MKLFVSGATVGIILGVIGGAIVLGVLFVLLYIFVISRNSVKKQIGS